MRWQARVLVAIVITILVAPSIVTIDPMTTNSAQQMQPPTYNHILGTDVLGRDVFSRIIHGGQRTLLIAFFASGLAAIVGTLLGVVVGMSKNWVDHTMSIVMNALLAFPNLLLALMILTLMGSGGVPLTLATGFSQIIPFALVSRSTVRSVRSTTYVEATYALGASEIFVTLHSILPNIYPVLRTYGGITFSYCLLNSAALSFLGLGGQPGIPDWGVMLAEGRMAFRSAPWIAIAPGLAITISVWMVNSLTGYHAREKILSQ